MSAAIKLNVPAAEGGHPVRTAYLPICKPFIGTDEKEGVLEALDSGWLSRGPKTRAFEEAIRDFTGAGHALALNSCTAGLHLALKAAGVGPGDEVITSPFTFSATANVILHTGATPVLVDIDARTFNVTAERMAEKISPRTRVLMPVHYGGQPCDLDPINALAKANDLLVVEDAATAIGAEYKGRPVGSWEDHVAVFSFYATKNMTTGDGGMLTTGLDDIAESARILSLHGMSRDAWKRYSAAGSWYFEISAPGFKYNLTDIQSAIGIAQLRRLNDFIKRRETICTAYDRAFAELPEVITPYVDENVLHSRHLYPILLDTDRLHIDRDAFIEALRTENIGTSVHYIPVHFHPYYQQHFGYGRGDFPVTEHVFDRILSLPLYPHMEPQDVEDVILAVRRLVTYYRR